jgi:hypothetical protein
MAKRMQDETAALAEARRLGLSDETIEALAEALQDPPPKKRPPPRIQRRTHTLPPLPLERRQP